MRLLLRFSPDLVQPAPFTSRFCALTITLISCGMVSIHPAALAADLVELEVISVRAATERADGPVAGYRATRSATATRTDTPIQEIPRAISVIPAEVLDDLGEERIDRVLDFAGGVARNNNFGGLSLSGYNVRGFNTGAIYRNGFAINRGDNTAPDAATIERVEVLKGPDSGLFGKGEPGGLVNIVTKRPQTQAFTRLTMRAGRWDRYRGSADINTPLTEDGSVLARFNVALEDNGSFRDHVFNQRQVFASAFSWRISASTRLTFDGEFIHNKNIFDRGVMGVNGDLDAVRISNFYGDPSDQAHNRTGLAQIGLEHAPSDDWKLRLATQYYRGHMETYYSAPYEPMPSAPDTVLRSRLHRDREWRNTQHQFDIQGKFDWLGWRHQILLGAAYEKHRGRGQEQLADASVAYGVDIWHPVYDKPLPAFTSGSDSSSREKSWAVHFQDQIHMSDRLIAVLGARYERVTTFGRNNQTQRVTSDYVRDAFVPRAGLLVKLTPEVNLFTNASRSFKPNGVAPSTGDAYEPETGVGYELGTKLDLLDGRLGATLAAFHITKKNVLTANPDPGSANRIAVGEQRSQGFDVQVSGKVTQSLRVIGAYAYINAKVTKDNNTPNTTGNRLAGVPWHNSSVLAVYSLGDMEFGGSINHVGARRANNNNISTVELPSYRTVDLFTRWRATDHVNVTLNLNNLLNKRYYTHGWVTRHRKGWTTDLGIPGDPRNVKLTVSVDL